MSKETESIISVMAASGIEHAVTDINTDGVHAANGNHYKKDCTEQFPCNPVDTKKGKEGRAVDFAHRRFDGKSDTPELLTIYNFFIDNYARNDLLNELFYAGPNADMCVFAGKFMRWDDVPQASRIAIRSTHHNHVHVAVSHNVFLAAPQASASRHKGEEENEDMPKPETRVDACLAPGGGVWTLQFDGGVRATGGAEFLGSYPMLPASRKKGTRNFIAIEVEADGYTIISDDDEASRYHFNPQVHAELLKRSRHP